MGRDERERGPRVVNGRPRKTQDELDKEMEDYWTKKDEVNGTSNGTSGAPPIEHTEPETAATAVVDEDIDMIV